MRKRLMTIVPPAAFAVVLFIVEAAPRFTRSLG